MRDAGLSTWLRVTSLHMLCVLQGCLTLLLGPPSCGKTTFLRALAGRLPQGDYSGSVTYDRHGFIDFRVPRTAAFAAQSDAHIPNYSAQEATSFAFDLQHGPNGCAFPLFQLCTHA